LKSILFVTKFSTRFLQIFGSRTLSRFRAKTDRASRPIRLFSRQPPQNIKNGLGLASKTRALAPPRGIISLLASAVLRVRVCAVAVRENAKPHPVAASLAACTASNSRYRIARPI